MDYNVEETQSELRTEFEKMLQFITSEEAQKSTADEVERSLFHWLLKLGLQLLSFFFQTRSYFSQRDKLVVKGESISYNSEQKREYFSIFGKVPFRRPYFYSSQTGGHTPLDEELGLGEDRYSDFLREHLEYLAVYVPFGKAVAIMKRLLKSSVSTRVEQELVAEDAEDVLAYYEQKPAPAAKDEGELLVIQADGKGVPIIFEKSTPSPVRLGKGEKRGRKKEAIVTTVYTIGRHPRTPKEVVESFFQEEKSTIKSKAAPPRPQNKQIWATLDGKSVALARLGEAVASRHGTHIQAKIALADGCPALQARIEEEFPDFFLVLDFVHANEYLWKVANSLFGETDERREKWVKEKTEWMLSGKTQQVIDTLRSQAKEKSCTQKQAEQSEKTANYFERNLDYMAYDTYLANGWPIASGVIEGACRHFVKDRLELSGMRWEQKGAENLLRLRAIAENDDWDDYHAFRRQQRHLRLYETPLKPQHPPETRALELPLPATASHVNKVTNQPIAPQKKLPSAAELPLAI